MAEKVILHVVLPMIPHQQESSTGRMIVWIQEKLYLAGMKWAYRKTCEILTFNTKKSKTVSLVLPPNVSILLLSALLYDGLHINIVFLRCGGHLDRLLMCSE